MKKINGKSIIALDWSKNGENSKTRERFGTDVMIINTTPEIWWKKSPADVSTEEKESKYYSSHIPAGIYLISHTFCKENVTLSSNNKTNSLIDSKQLYKMLKESMKHNMVIEFPLDIPKRTFNILNAFEN
jgi:hypothetical protein